MISCIIIEDQPPAQRILQKYIRDIGTLKLKGTFGDALSALEFLKNEQVQLIFLDVHLPKISGLDFLNILSPRPKVILTTAFTEYALQAYELDVVDYLKKPFSFKRFVKAVSKVIFHPDPTHTETQPLPGEVSEQPAGYIFIKSGQDYLKIEKPEIQYIKSDGDYTRVFYNQSKYLVSHSLRYWLKHLPSAYFCQIHKSYIVNIRFIQKVSGNQVFLDETIIPIGRTFRDSFFAKYLDGS